jgi:peptide-methionine (R)-S-oxide reductase
MSDELPNTDAGWRARLTPFEYHVLREKGTERAFTGALWDHFRPGAYHCAGCDTLLFRSETKFDHGCGWPAFTQGVAPESIREIPDHSWGMIRVEVVCARCGGHLGHLFDDGPRPLRTRYCINSASLRFVADSP